MTEQGRRSVAIPIVALLLVALVVGDAARRVLTRPPAASAAAPTLRPGPPEPGAEAGGGSRTMAAAVGATARLDSATRVAVLLRIGREGEDTYLPAMLAAGDSTLHRWADERAARPIRVAVLRQPVPGFREVFVSNVEWAVTRWNAVGLPVYLESIPDSALADIVVEWADHLDSNRAGRADVSWQRSGPLVHVVITLATHTPDGRQVLPSQMVALALHELGHALGLGHSPVATDALHPETSATDLTARDRRTAALLYSIPPGSLK